MKKRLILSVIFTLFMMMPIENIKADYEAKEETIYINETPGMTGHVKEASGIAEEGIIPICIYSCSKDNSTEYTKTSEGKYESGPLVSCGLEGDLWNIITYNTKQINLKWGIYSGTTYEDPQIAYQKINGMIVPKTLFGINSWKNRPSVSQPSIYYEESTNLEKDQEWDKTTTSFKNIDESFICPKYAYYDNTKETVGKNDMEICYQDEENENKCKTRDEEGKTGFYKPNPLAYSFAEELDKVLNATESKLSSLTYDQIAYLYLAKSNISDEKWQEEVENNMCELFEDEQVINKFTSSAKIQEGINEILHSAWRSVNVSHNLTCLQQYNIDKDTEKYNKCIFEQTENETNNPTRITAGDTAFTVKILSTLMVKQDKMKIEPKQIMYNGVSLTDKYNSFIYDGYKDKLKATINNYKIKCEAKNNEKYNFDENEFSNNYKEMMESISKEILLVDLEELSCDNIFHDFADEIKTIYFFMEILSIVLIVAVSALDYAKIILSDNQDEFKKANKKTTRRIILLVTLFLLPAILNTILGLFKIEGFNSDNPLCVNVTEK